MVLRMYFLGSNLPCCSNDSKAPRRLVVYVQLWSNKKADKAVEKKSFLYIPECISDLQLAGPSESISRLGLRSKISKEDAAGAASAGEAAIASAKAFGQVILTAGYDGVIKVFENLSPPHWL